MTVGEIAGLISAIAFCFLVILLGIPLLKTGRVLEELRLTIRDLGHNSVPILQELKGTVTATNSEIEKVGVITEDAAKVTSNVSVISGNLAKVSTIFMAVLGGPLVKVAAFTYGLRKTIKEKANKPARAKRARRTKH